MSDEQEQMEAEADGLEQEAPEQDEQETSQQTDERETLARKLGWRPEAEYEGSAKWMDLDEFLESRQGTAKTTHRLNQVIREQERKIKRFEKMLNEVKGFEQRAYERAVKDLKAQHRQAAETGDMDAFDRIGDELDELHKSAVKETKAEPERDDASIAELTTEWLIDNPWYTEDAVKRRWADIQIEKLGGFEGYDGAPEDLLAEIKERAEKRFGIGKPEQKPAVKKVNPVGGANGMRVAPKAGDTYASASQEEKHMAQQMVKAGLFKTVDDYIRELRK